MSKWPSPYDGLHEPPEYLYLGVDEDKGNITTTWWIWRMKDDDIVYIRKDIADRRIRELKEKYNAQRKSSEALGEVSGTEKAD